MDDNKDLKNDNSLEARFAVMAAFNEQLKILLESYGAENDALKDQLKAAKARAEKAEADAVALHAALPRIAKDSTG